MAPILWLPNDIPYSSYNGNFFLFVNDIYQVFIGDFYRSGLTFQGKSVNIDTTLVQGKMMTFWKMVSEKFNTPQEQIDFRRCECLCWARPIIENANSPEVTLYKDYRKKKGRPATEQTVLWLESHDYKVVLRERPGSFFLVSTHHSDWQHSRAKQGKERDVYFRSLQP